MSSSCHMPTKSRTHLSVWRDDENNKNNKKVVRCFFYLSYRSLSKLTSVHKIHNKMYGFPLILFIAMCVQVLVSTGRTRLIRTHSSARFFFEIGEI